MGEKLYTTREAAEALGVTYMTVWKWIKSGKLRANKVFGGRYAIPAEEVERLLKEKRGE